MMGLRESGSCLGNVINFAHVNSRSFAEGLDGDR
jgi:hypothetical protein